MVSSHWSRDRRMAELGLIRVKLSGLSWTYPGWYEKVVLIAGITHTQRLLQRSVSLSWANQSGSLSRRRLIWIRLHRCRDNPAVFYLGPYFCHLNTRQTRETEESLDVSLYLHVIFSGLSLVFHLRWRGESTWNQRQIFFEGAWIFFPPCLNKHLDRGDSFFGKGTVFNLTAETWVLLW